MASGTSSDAAFLAQLSASLMGGKAPARTPTVTDHSAHAPADMASPRTFSTEQLDEAREFMQNTSPAKARSHGRLVSRDRENDSPSSPHNFSRRSAVALLANSGGGRPSAPAAPTASAGGHTPGEAVTNGLGSFAAKPERQSAETGTAQASTTANSLALPEVSHAHPIANMPSRESAVMAIAPVPVDQAQQDRIRRTQRALKAVGMGPLKDLASIDQEANIDRTPLPPSLPPLRAGSNPEEAFRMITNAFSTDSVNSIPTDKLTGAADEEQKTLPKPVVSRGAFNSNSGSSTTTKSTSINNIIAEFAALKTEVAALTAKVKVLEGENFDMLKKVEVLVQNDERRKFLGTDSAKTPFAINVSFPDGATHRVQVHAELRVAEVIRRARVKGNIEPKDSLKPRLMVKDLVVGHGMMLGELGVTKDEKVAFVYGAAEEEAL